MLLEKWFHIWAVPCFSPSHPICCISLRLVHRIACNLHFGHKWHWRLQRSWSNFPASSQAESWRTLGWLHARGLFSSHCLGIHHGLCTRSSPMTSIHCWWSKTSHEEKLFFVTRYSAQLFSGSSKYFRSTIYLKTVESSGACLSSQHSGDRGRTENSSPALATY